MANLLAFRIETNMFNFHKDIDTFTQEVSTLGDDTLRQMRRQLYDDACDEGFVLVSSKTGKEVRMYLHHIATSEDGVTNWDFMPCEGQGYIFKLTVFND